MKYKRVYVGQFGSWWSFTMAEWIQFVEKAITGITSCYGYSLPKEKQLKSQPNCLRRYSRSSRWFYSVKSNLLVIQPLDWALVDWQSHFLELRTGIILTDV